MFENGDVNGLGFRSVLDLDRREVLLLWSVRMNSSEDINTGGHEAMEMHVDFLAGTGCKEVMDMVINV